MHVSPAGSSGLRATSGVNTSLDAMPPEADVSAALTFVNRDRGVPHPSGLTPFNPSISTCSPPARLIRSSDDRGNSMVQIEERMAGQAAILAVSGDDYPLFAQRMPTLFPHR